MKNSAFKISPRVKKIILFCCCYTVAAQCLTFYVLTMGANIQIELPDAPGLNVGAAVETSTEVDSIRI